MMQSIGIGHRPSSVPKPATGKQPAYSSQSLRFGEVVYTNAQYPLHTQLDRTQLNLLFDKLDATAKRLETSNQALKTAVDLGFQNLIAVLKASKITSP